MSPGFVHPGPVSFYLPVRSSLVNYVGVSEVAPLLFESRQNLSYTITASETFKDVAITEVDLSRAVIFIGGYRTDGNICIAFPRVYFTSAINVRAERGGLLGGLNSWGHFQVVELPASQVNSVQAVEAVIPGGSPYVDHTITEVDLDKSIILFCGQSCTSTEFSIINVLTNVFFQNSTTVRVIRGASGADFTVTTNAFVLECK